LNSFLFVSLPHIETLYPAAAFGALQPVVKKSNLQMHLQDVNVTLKHTVSADVFDEITNWSMFAKHDLSPEAEQCLLQAFQDNIDFTKSGWIGISVFSFAVARATVRFLKWMQTQTHNFKIVLGGNGCMSVLAEYGETEFGQWCLDQKICDYVVFGEGEKALENLLQGNSDYPGINNTNFQQIKNLDDLDLPDYSNINWQQYTDPRIMITGSRGCVRNCTFCDIALSWPKFTYRSAEKMVDEIKRMVNDHGMTRFEFTDSLINGSVKNFNRFNEQLIEAKQKDSSLEPVTYIGQFICRSAQTMPPETYELMHHAGCNQITVGIESFSERVRYHMKKKFSDADVDYHFEQCARWRIPNVILMIVGYPTETLADHMANIRALQKYKTYSDMGIIFMVRWGFTMTLFEGTPIAALKDELGLIEINQGHSDSVFNWVSTKNPTLDLRERIRRRLQLHELGVDLGYAMPNSKKELMRMLEVSKEYKGQTLIKAVAI